MVASGGSGWAAVDWVENWKRLVEERRRRVEAVGAVSGECSDFWDRRADQFRRLSEQHDPAADPLVTMLAEAAGPEGSLLDIGAGAGRYALPLAHRVGAVTAVEPSAGMRQHLAERIAQAGVTNVRVVASTWEAATIAPHDVVLAAHIVYPIAEIVPFLRKVAAHARRAWFLTIRVEPMGSELAPLWEAIHGTPYPVEPTFLDLYNLLFSIGLPANARLKPFAGSGNATDLDDAVQQARGRLFLAADDYLHDERIRQFLQAQMQQDGGSWRWPGQRSEAVVYTTT